MVSNNVKRAFLGSTGVLLIIYFHTKGDSRSQFCSTSVIELVSYRRFRAKRHTRPSIDLVNKEMFWRILELPPVLSMQSLAN